MRKLLVASQKSGVGKTTASINLAASAALSRARVLLVEADPLSGISAALNLAQHTDKRHLRAAGIDLPGVLWCGVVPGLDVFSPYEEGGCTDEDFDRVLQLLGLDAFRESYDCLVVNAPPFMGGRPAELLASCDEFVIVMQAEPLAYRTMPAFLEMVQRAGQGAGHAATFRGVVLTLPESEAPGGRWERELRGRFGTRVLPQVIPYDEEVGKATLFGHIVVQSSPEAAAAVAYQELAGSLQLARDARSASGRSVEATLTQAAAAVRDKPLVARTNPWRPASAGRKSSSRMPRFQGPGVATLPPRTETPAPAAVETVERPASPPPGYTTPERPGRRSGSRRPVTPTPPPPGPPTSPAPARQAAAPAAPAPHPQESAPAPVAPTRRAQAPLPPPLHSTQRPWLIWVGLAIAGGIGLRFVRLPEGTLPIMVGLVVTAGVTLLLHLFMGQNEKETPAASTTPPAREPAASPKAAPSHRPHRKKS